MLSGKKKLRVAVCEVLKLRLVALCNIVYTLTGLAVDHRNVVGVNTLTNHQLPGIFLASGVDAPFWIPTIH